MANRLAQETSPYLLQHQNNPVDWYPWAEEAFARAKAENKPIFLSVGYSSCHWCHVMEHESFEDEDVAATLNEHFVCVKVDREERPDVDEAYMTAVQITSGRGGWPMSVFLTPDRRPFFAGTYFPKEDRGQHPGMQTLLPQIANAWETRQPDIEKAADEISAALRETLSARAPATFTEVGEGLISDGIAKIISDFDSTHGGFGGAPKFPPHSGIELLLTYTLRPDAPREVRQATLSASLFTLRQMAMGGIHDHVGGGFHRYSTDEAWLLPHFEKMLYDNALLLGNYARGAGIAAEVDQDLSLLFQVAAAGIVGWMEREMLAPEGYFYSALDADSEGAEGKFYIWSEDEIRSVLGDRAEAFLATYRFKPEGNYFDEATRELTGLNIPHLGVNGSGQKDEIAAVLFREDLEKLREARESRVRPGLDDKALVGWNGLAISGLTEAGALNLAERAAGGILAAELAHGRLPHQIAKGKPSGDAYLEDYSHFADGLLKLATLLIELRQEGHAVESLQTPEYYVDQVARLAREMVEKFYDEEAGGFFATSKEHEELFGRTKPVFDQPIPSANHAAIRVLLAIGDEKRARQSLNALKGWMERAPQATEALYSTAMLMIDTAEEPEPVPVAPVAPPKPAQVEISLSPKEAVAGADGRARFTVTIRIPEGLHVNSSQPPARWLTPTKVDVRPLKAAVEYPVATNDRYEGDLVIPFDVQLPTGQDGAEFEVKVSYQACTETECQLATEKTFGAVIVRG